MWIWALGTAVFLRCNTLVTSGGILHLLHGGICACHIWDPLYLFTLQPLPFLSCQLHVRTLLHTLSLHRSASSLPPLLALLAPRTACVLYKLPVLQPSAGRGRIFIRTAECTRRYMRVYTYKHRCSIRNRSYSITEIPTYSETILLRGRAHIDKEKLKNCQGNLSKCCINPNLKQR